VEIGCKGGLGRTGTALACMAILARVPISHAVIWVQWFVVHLSTQQARTG
jgi:hypothetical protein